MEKVKSFLRKKEIEISVKRYLIDALSFMALGLFSSLLIGTIFETIGTRIPRFEIFAQIAGYAKTASGPAMAVAIAFALKSPHLVIFSCAAVGVVGNALGGPVGCLIATIIGAEFGKAVSKETAVDILVTPTITIFMGSIAALLAGPPIDTFMKAFGSLIMYATDLQPLIMGVLVSVLMGIALTLPISSAAICVMLNLSGLAAGAATAGCCAQMVGFAVMSYRENKLGGLVSIGLGTSMLQVPNIIKNPRIWLPPILVSMITGPLATVVFKMENIPIGAGMGTSGLVGPLGVISAMPNTPSTWLAIFTVCFLVPAVLTPIFTLFLKKIHWIKDGDLTINI